MWQSGQSVSEAIYMQGAAIDVGAQNFWLALLVGNAACEAAAGKSKICGAQEGIAVPADKSAKRQETSIWGGLKCIDCTS